MLTMKMVASPASEAMAIRHMLTRPPLRLVGQDRTPPPPAWSLSWSGVLVDVVADGGNKLFLLGTFGIRTHEELVELAVVKMATVVETLLWVEVVEVWLELAEVDTLVEIGPVVEVASLVEIRPMVEVASLVEIGPTVEEKGPVVAVSSRMGECVVVEMRVVVASSRDDGPGAGEGVSVGCSVSEVILTVERGGGGDKVVSTEGVKLWPDDGPGLVTRGCEIGRAHV